MLSFLNTHTHTRTPINPNPNVYKIGPNGDIVFSRNRGSRYHPEEKQCRNDGVEVREMHGFDALPWRRLGGLFGTYSRGLRRDAGGWAVVVCGIPDLPLLILPKPRFLFSECTS